MFCDRSLALQMIKITQVILENNFINLVIQVILFTSKGHAYIYDKMFLAKIVYHCKFLYKLFYSPWDTVPASRPLHCYCDLTRQNANSANCFLKFTPLSIMPSGHYNHFCPYESHIFVIQLSECYQYLFIKRQCLHVWPRDFHQSLLFRFQASFSCMLLYLHENWDIIL